jgi:hypothetical protein
METKKHVYDGKELPSCLGYGILNEQSVHYKNGELYAEYVFDIDNSLVHTVKWSKNCELLTYCQGNSVRQSQYPDLQKALLYGFWSWELEKCDCFKFLVDKTIGLGNIYVKSPKTDERDASFCYYPAGKLFIFSLPFFKRTERYYAFINQLNESRLLKLFREIKGLLLIMNNDGVVINQPIEIAQFVVPLAHVYSASKAMVDAGVIENQKHFRLIIDEASNSQKNLMQTFLGETKGSFYSIVFKEFSSNEIPSVEMMFANQVEALKIRIQDGKYS